MITEGQQLTAGRGQVLEAMGVDLGRVDGQQVADGMPDEGALGQHSTEPRDLGLQGVLGVAGRLLAVHGVDQLIERNGPADAQRQGRE